MSDDPFERATIVDAYTRAQAMEDGVLIDVTQQAREAGFTLPVAMTSALFNDYIVPDERAKCQDVSGRLWDVFSVLKFHIKQRPDVHMILFRCNFVMKEKQKRLVELQAIVHAGDTGEPVMTISLRGED